jgi:hypothetical protein
VGHIGGNLSSLDMLMTLYHEILLPEDAFVLSKGHSAGAAFSERFLVPHGNSVVHFSSPAAPLIPPNDPRKLVFRVEDLRLGNPLLTPTIIFK